MQNVLSKPGCIVSLPDLANTTLQDSPGAVDHAGANLARAKLRLCSLGIHVAWYTEEA